ncbi:hypothetical protein Tco_0087895 [Tanacetum coccineum]
MVAYLKKPEGSEEFHQIIDFLNASHIRYALTENPTIYVSLIKQFWETATARTLDNEEIELTATIDGKVKIVTEGPIVQGKGLTHPVESYHTPTSAPSTSLPPVSPTSRRTTRQESMVPQPRSPTQSPVADEVASTEIQGRHEHDMEFDFDLDATKDVSTSEKDVSTAKPVSTASAVVTTASVVVSTAKDKGKAKMDESKSETAQTKTKLQQEQERLGYETSVRLQAKLEEEERQRIARRLQAKEREMYTEAEQARMLQLRGYSFDEIKNLFETTMRRVHTFVLKESEIEKVIPELAVGSSKRDAEEELDQESCKRQKTVESSKPAEEPKDKEEELSQEELQQMMIVVPEQGMNVEALQTKYPIIDWEIYTEGTRKYWKIIRVGNHSERFNLTEPTDDKERDIWVELKRLFELNTDDEEGYRHLYADREGVSIVKRNSYIDAGCKALVFHMAQQVVPAAQLVPRYHTIGRCNNYVVLQSIPCSPELETPENPFVAPVNIQTIEAFMNMVSYQGVVDKLIIADLMKKFPNIPQSIDEDYHSINDDIPLEYEMVFVGVDVPMNQPQPVVSTQGTHRQMQVVAGKKDDDDSEDRLEPGSHKENPKHVDDDDEEEKVDENKDDEMGSLEIRTEEMQTPIPTTSRSPRPILSSDKNITQELMDTTHKKVDRVLNEIIPQLVERATDDLIENNLKPSIAATIIEDRDAFRSEVPDLVSQELNAQAPKIIEELFKNYVQSNVIQVHPTTTTYTETTSSADLQQQLYLKMKRSLQDQANDPALWEVLKHTFEKSSTANTSCRDKDIHSQRHDDHQEDDAPPEGEKREWDAWVEETVIDEDEVIPKDKTPELITELQNVDKHAPTIFDRARIEAILNDMLSNQFKNAEEYAYHLEQTINSRENQIVWESRQEDIRHPVPRPLIFFGPQRNLNEPPSVQAKSKKSPEDYFSNHGITEVVRITIDQPYSLDFMEQIIMMRENDKPDSFSEADFKYLNKNDIEDFYYLFRNKKERVHDFQLGIESYQVKVNLTAPTLTFSGIKAYEPYSIVDKPNTGLIYLNSKDEKRVMYLVEIVKFCDATLEKVLKEVKLKIFQSKPWKKPPLLGELDHDIMRAFEREITKRLSH